MKKVISLISLLLIVSVSAGNSSHFGDDTNYTPQYTPAHVQNPGYTTSKVLSRKLMRVCYDYKEQCLRSADFVRVLSNDNVSLKSYCRRVENYDYNDACYGKNWILNTTVRILK